MRLDDGRVIPNFIQQALRQERLTVYGDGNQTRSFCYVDDLIDGILGLAFSVEDMPVNIGNPDEFTIIELAHMVNELLHNPSENIYQVGKVAGDDPLRRQPDISRAREILDWTPKFDLKSGLLKTIPYFKEKMGLNDL
jgi:dTDP-glucose 4,6-dehydratase